MASTPILLVGAGGHAVSCIDVIEQQGEFTVAGLIGSGSEVGSTVLGYPVIGTDEELPSLVARYGAALIAVGQIRTSELRIRLFELLVRLGSQTPTIVSPRAYVSRHAKLGAGTIVMHGALVNAAASIGRNCIVNSNALIEHHATIADHCHISTATVVNGEVAIGAGTFVGSNSEIRQGVRIGDRCVIGMGQRVLTDCAAGTTLPSLKEHA
jgi:sugar O-acyltransferase (sialic acid O-acetyltransferase NeuD family)